MCEGHGVTEQDVGHNTDLLVLVGLRRLHNTKATQAKSSTFREQLTVVEVEVEVPKIFFL